MITQIKWPRQRRPPNDQWRDELRITSRQGGCGIGDPQRALYCKYSMKIVITLQEKICWIWKKNCQMGKTESRELLTQLCWLSNLTNHVFSNLTTKFGNLTVKFSFQFLKCRKIVCYFENKTRYQISGYQISLPLPPSLPPFLPASLCFSTSPLFTLSVYAQIGTVNMPHKRKDAEDFQTSFWFQFA